MIAYDRVIDAFRANGLNVVEHGTGKSSAQAPGHSSADKSVSIRDIGDQVLIYSHSDDTADVLDSLGLALSDLFDSPKGSTYEYPDGRVVRRSPDKRFSQLNASGKTSLYRASKLWDAPVVYMVEGEKDVHALESEGVVATCTAMGAGKAHLFDLSPLVDTNVLIVRDMDDPGFEHVRQLIGLLPGSAVVQVLEPAVGKDAADHVGAGFGLSEFVDVSFRFGRELFGARLKFLVTGGVSDRELADGVGEALGRFVEDVL